MKAWLLTDFKGLDALKLADVPDPRPGAGEVLLRVEYAGLNPADRYLSEGHYPAKPSLPHILGRDGVGTIIEVGKDVSQFKVGQQVMMRRGDVGVNRAGTLAEKVATPTEFLETIPQGWSKEQAAAASLVYLTAYQALTMWGNLPPSVVLITGASGGVGIASIQLAIALGHTVAGLSRDEKKREQLKAHGVAVGLDPEDSRWTAMLKEFLAPRRVDLAIDNVAGPLLAQVIETMAFQGRISLVGALAGPVPAFNTASLFFRRLKMGGVAVGTYSAPDSHAAWGKVLELLGKTGAKPVVDQIFKFEDLIPAFQYLKKGPMGKVLVRVGGDD